MYEGAAESAGIKKLQRLRAACELRDNFYHLLTVHFLPERAAQRPLGKHFRARERPALERLKRGLLVAGGTKIHAQLDAAGGQLSDKRLIGHGRGAKEGKKLVCAFAGLLLCSPPGFKQATGLELGALPAVNRHAPAFFLREAVERGKRNGCGDFRKFCVKPVLARDLVRAKSEIGCFS